MLPNVPDPPEPCKHLHSVCEFSEHFQVLEEGEDPDHFVVGDRGTILFMYCEDCHATYTEVYRPENVAQGDDHPPQDTPQASRT